VRLSKERVQRLVAAIGVPAALILRRSFRPCRGSNWRLRSMPRGVDRLALATVLPTSAAVLCGLATPIEVMILGCLEGARHFAGRRDVF
jgi:hypothetical protein